MLSAIDSFSSEYKKRFSQGSRDTSFFYFGNKGAHLATKDAFLEGKHCRSDLLQRETTLKLGSMISRPHLELVCIRNQRQLVTTTPGYQFKSPVSDELADLSANRRNSNDTENIKFPK